MNALEYAKYLQTSLENFEKGWSGVRVMASELATLVGLIEAEQAAATAPAAKTTKATKTTAQTTTTEDNADAA